MITLVQHGKICRSGELIASTGSWTRLSTILALIHSRSRMPRGKWDVLCLAWYALCLSAGEVYLASLRRLRFGFSICSGFGRLRRDTSTRQYLQQYFACRLLTLPRVPFGPFLQRGFQHKRSAGLSEGAIAGTGGGPALDNSGRISYLHA